MVEQTAFRGAIDFLNKIGIYDVVLPFLLIFTIVFAILEKTKIFGMEKIGKEEYTKKNLNAMVSFVVAFLVVASSKLVAIINEAMANVVLLLLLSVAFLMLIGSFFSYKEEAFLEKGPWRTSFMIIMAIGVFLVFANAIKTDGGESWLSIGWNFIASYWNSAAIGSIILLIIIIFSMWYVTSGGKKPEKKEEKKE